MREEHIWKAVIIVGIAVFILLGFNIYSIYGLSNPEVDSLVSSPGELNYAGQDVRPMGIPAIYGAELNIKYEYVSPTNQQLADQTIHLLGSYDVNIQLNQEEMTRYINILFKMHDGISCEYCCDAPAVIFENGKAACGCAHSYAMRGLTKYLIKNHGNEFTDEQIYTEVAKWKTLFFPNQINAKAKVLQEKGIPVTYTNLGSNEYRGIKVDSNNYGLQMVGGC